MKATMEMNRSRVLAAVEPVLIGLEEMPWSATYRFVLGFAMMASAVATFGERPPLWSVAAYVVATLLALRLVPAIVRRIVPFSVVAQAAWSRRRRLAKRSDAYQWQKLFWMGAGMTAYVVVFDRVRSGRFVLASVCLTAGLIGKMFWEERAWRSPVR